MVSLFRVDSWIVALATTIIRSTKSHEMPRKHLSFRVGSWIVLPGKRISENRALVQFANKLGTQATWRKKCSLQNRER